jgi:hypothetical protein
MATVLLLLGVLLPALAQHPNLCPNQPADPWAQMRCPASATCSPNGFSDAGGWGCCPWANATSCPSGYQCCPSGSTCSLISGSGYGATYTCTGGAAPAGTTSLCPCKPGVALPPSTTKKNVLVIGDSLSIGYTPPLAANLSDIALVQHAPWDTHDGGAEESAYLNQCLSYWLTSPSGLPWTPDLIVFNSGMHNLAGPCTPGHGCTPGQGDSSDNYAAPMAAATARLVAFAAASGGKTKLLLALTTPYLCSVATDSVIHGVLNVNASTIAATYGLPVLDPYTAIVNKCGKAPVASCFGVRGVFVLRPAPPPPPHLSFFSPPFLAPCALAPPPCCRRAAAGARTARQATSGWQRRCLRPRSAACCWSKGAKHANCRIETRCTP